MQTILCAAGLLAGCAAVLMAADAAARSKMIPWADSSRTGHPFAKDPCVVRLKGRYLLYYSMQPAADKSLPPGWAIGIAQSDDLVNWKKIGEILPQQECEKNGLVNGRESRTDEERPRDLSEIRKDMAYFGRSFHRADLRVDIDGLDVEGSAAKIEALPRERPVGL